MTLSFEQRSKLLDLIADRLDGCETAQSASQLNAWLAKSAPARVLYIDQLDLHAHLSWSCRPLASAGALGLELGVNESCCQKVSLPAGSRWFGRVSQLVPGGEWTVGTLVVLAVVAAFIGLATAFTRSMLSSGDMMAIAGVKSTSVIDLAQKFDEVRLRQGTILHVSANARWAIEGDNVAVLHSGSVVASVPQQAIGFRLRTPTAEIIDLGTEFAVNVTNNLQTEVRVLRGAVDVVPIDADRSSEQATRLAAGEGRRVLRDLSTGTARIEPLDEAVAGAQHKSRLQLWCEASAKLQLDASLLTYYDFEHPLTPLRNAIADQLHGQIVPGKEWGRTDGRWRRKGAMVFYKEFATATVPQFGAFPPAGDWSLALWFRLDNLPGHFAQMVGKGVEPQREFSLWMQPSGNLHVSQHDQTGGNCFIDGTRPALVNRWNFVVVVQQQGQLQLFVNGQPTGTPLLVNERLPTSDSSLVLGHSLEPTYPEVFTGAFDELALFGRALSAQEIADWYVAGCPDTPVP